MFGDNWREKCFPREHTIFEKMLYSHFATAQWTMKQLLQAIDHSGLQIVPKEPTPEMLEGARFSMSTWHDIKGAQLTVNDEKAKIRYKAMLEKAPKFGHE
jgi:hypothetical protein